MKDSEEKETRISNLKNMRDNMSNNKENIPDSFDEEELYEYNDSDDYEIVNAEDMINKLSEDYNKYSEEEFTIDDEYIYKPSEGINHNIIPIDGEIDENFLIKTKLENTEFSEEDTDEYVYHPNSDLDPFSFDSTPQEEYINEKFDNLLRKKIGNYSILAIAGLIIGILFIIFAILTSLSSQKRIIDNVSSGEVNTTIAIFILLGLLFIILSIYKLLAIKSPFDNVIASMKSVDKEKISNSSKDEEVVIEQKPLANDNKKVKKVGEFDISSIKQKIEDADNNLDNVKHKTEPRDKTTESNEETPLSEEEEYEKAKLDSESIDEIFADMREIEDMPVISIDSKEEK